MSGGPSTSDNAVLEVRGLTKRFPGVLALDRVDFQLRRGEVHALVGENGAGKSTLIHLLGGIYAPDGGEIRSDGQPVHLSGPHQAAALGIAIAFQELSLAPNMSVAENVFCNRQPVGTLGLVRRRALAVQTRTALASFDLRVNPWMPVKHLSVAQAQVIEILKALSASPRVLILDEPTASLGSAETERLFTALRGLQAAGRSVIYVSHRLAEVLRIADRVSVLRDGRPVATRRTAEVSEEELARLMVGRPLANIYGSRTTVPGAEVFRLDDGACAGCVGGINVTVRQGEIVGLAGLIGAGRTELARAIFGAEPLTGGRLWLRGQPVRIRSPRDAIRLGIGYVTEDRKGQGLFLKMPLRENCVSPNLAGFANNLGLIQEPLVSAFAETSRRHFRIITPSLRQQVRNLSGGNQQKVLLAMWAGIRPALLIVDEPTRGVDIGARSEIYQLLREATTRGVGILMISSDLPELLGMCDRIFVLRAGRLVGQFSREEATEEAIIACATGTGRAV
jgi:ABC-type sugar transport system ATPase subunit